MKLSEKTNEHLLSNLKVFTAGALTCADCVGQLLRLLQCVDCRPPGCASSHSSVTSYLYGSGLPGIGSGRAPLQSVRDQAFLHYITILSAGRIWLF